MQAETHGNAEPGFRNDTRQASGPYQAVLGAWRRRKWLAILPFLGLCTVVISAVKFLPDVYRSAATVLVERQKVPEKFVPSTITSDIDDRLQTITQQTLSRSRLESLIERFNLYAEMRQEAPLERVLERMRQDIRLERKRGFERGRSRTTTAFTIGYAGKDPQTVAQVANALASFYIEENLKVREQQATGTAEFLRVQLESMRGKLEEQEQRLSQFKERYMGELPEQLGANLAALEGLNTQLRFNGEKQAAVSAQRSALMQLLVAREKEAGETPIAAELSESDARRRQLALLRQELTILRQRFSDSYPDVIQLKLQIAALEQRPVTTATNSAKSDTPRAPAMSPPGERVSSQLYKDRIALDAELEALRAQEHTILRTIALYQQRVENTPRREQEMQILLRNYGTTKERYESLLARQQEAELAESLEQRQQGERFRLLEPATPATTPVEPNRRKLALVGIMLSLCIAVSIVFIAEFLDTSFHTVEELRAFSRAPVLVRLPYVITAAEARRKRWQYGFVTIAMLLGLALIVISAYVTIKGLEELGTLWVQVQQLLQTVRELRSG